MSLLAKAILCITLLALSACARPVTDYPGAEHSAVVHEMRTQLGNTLDKQLIAQRRLFQSAGPIFTANAALCPRRAMTLGFNTISDFDLPKDMQGIAYEYALLGRDAQVLGVIPGLEAWLDGVRPGDTIMTLNGMRVRNAADMRARLRKITHADKPVSVGFIRNGRAYEVSVTPVPICNYRLLYLEGQREINAAANGSSIVVTQGLMDFSSDAELGLTLGHELAHNIMHHVRKDQQNADAIEISRDVIDFMTGFIGIGDPAASIMTYVDTKVWSPRFEKEADYVGLYLVARAGGHIDGAADLERRLGVEHGSDMIVEHNPLKASTHPFSAERAAIQAKTIAEIREKQRTGKPLMPNLRKPWVYGQKYSWMDADEEDPWVDEDLNH